MPYLTIQKRFFEDLTRFFCRPLLRFYTTIKWNVKMSAKTAWGGKGAGRILADTAANASCVQDSKKSPGMSPVEEEDELPLAWHKLSNMLLQSFNEQFDKFEQSFQNILSTQRELTERLTTTESQAADHEQRIHAVETSVAELRERIKHCGPSFRILKGDPGATI